MLDPNLRALLISELRKHSAALAPGAGDDRAAGRALHAAKGAAGVAGERALADTLARIERRFRAGETAALRDARDLVDAAIVNLEAGHDAWRDPWPHAPVDLKPRSFDDAIAERYVSEMRDRIAAIDAALASSTDPAAVEQETFRHVHTMKGAALAVGDELLAWFCHGLEARLRRGSGAGPSTVEALAELTRWRTLLGQLVEDPERALENLRTASLRPSALPRPGTDAPPAPRADASPQLQGWLRVPAPALDRVLERIGRLASFGGEYRAHADLSRELARALRDQRASLVEAQRLIGPPRPWGAPAAAIARIEAVAHALGADADRLEQQAARTRAQARGVRDDVAASQADLGAMRQASMSLVFEPARAAVEAIARSEGRLLQVATVGAAVPIDRKLAEALVDPVMQLARNAVAHGIEPPQQRRAAGKPDVGTVTLRASVRGALLVVSVEDDGAGVDAEAVRREAIASGAIGAELAGQAADDMLLELLFTPGLTTQASPDLLAGRGVGLDLVQQVVRRYGGTIRITNYPGLGFAASLELPVVARGLIPALWVESAGRSFALACAGILHVRRADASSDAAAPSLAACLDPFTPTHDRGPFVVVLGHDLARASAPVRVERIGKLDRVAARPAPPLLAVAGPYAGVVVTPTGSPALLVDGAALVERMPGLSVRTASTPPPAG